MLPQHPSLPCRRDESFARILSGFRAVENFGADHIRSLELWLYGPAAHGFKSSFNIGDMAHSALPADGDGCGKAVELLHCRRNLFRENLTYGIVFQGEKQ